MATDNNSNGKDKLVLVTGAGGFIGRVLCRQLLAAGYRVRGFQRRPLPADLAARVEHHQGDLVDVDLVDTHKLQAAMAEVAVVFHLASIAHVHGAGSGDLQRVVVRGTEAVLAAAEQAGVRKLVYFSSSLAQLAERDGKDQRQGDRRQGGRRQEDRRQEVRRQEDRRQGDRRQEDRRQEDRRQGDRRQGDQRQGDQRQGDRRQKDQRQGDRRQKDQRQGDRRQKDRKQREQTGYGQAKWQAEQLLRKNSRHTAVTIIRPVNVYGIGMGGNLARLIDLIARRRLPPLPRLQTELALVGVEDLCRAARLCAEASVTDGRTYLVGDGERYAMNDLEAAIYSALGRRRPGWHTPAVVLYAAALTMELIGLVSPGKRGLGLRTFRNLRRGHYIQDTSINKDTGFQASTTFYRELPAIVASMQSDH